MDVVIGKQKLVSGLTKSCGCLTKTEIPEGTVFGDWTVGPKVKLETGGKQRYYFQCTCICGKVSNLDSRTLRKGMSTSCGCERSRRRILPNSGAAFNSLWDNYPRKARERKLPFTLMEKEFRILIGDNCTYCNVAPSGKAWPHRSGGDPLHYNGIDRKDATKGYTTENCVTSCFLCNRMKRVLTVSDFLIWVQKVNVGPCASVTSTIQNLAAQQQRSYRHSAKRRGYTYDLSKEEFVQLVNSSCHYCGSPPSNKGTTKKGIPYLYNGIDRVDNTTGYTVDNSVPCCANCNRAKSDMTLEDFKSHIARISAHQQASISTK